MYLGIQNEQKTSMCRLWITCCVLLLLTGLSCRQEKTQTKITIAFSQCVGNDAWRETMLQEMYRELSFHPEIAFLYRDANGNSQTQIEQIRELLAKDIDILIVSPNEAEPLTPIVDSVFQQDIPIIVTDRKTSSGLYNAYVGADNTAIGLLAGKYIDNILQGKGKIGIVRGLAGSSPAMEREKGLLQALEKTPGITVDLVLNGNWEKSSAYQLANSQIERIVNCDLIFAFNDQMALGIRQALRDHSIQKDIHIIGVDALPGKGNGLEEVTKGSLSASLLYPTGGAESIRTALAILQKKNYTRENILSTLVIDQRNADLMVMQSRKIENQQKDIDTQQSFIKEQNKIYQNQRTILNILVISLALAVIFGGISIIVIKSNREKNKHLEKQNEEILTQQQQIVDMSRQIQEVSEAKSKFFTNVSHEFKTPLTLILAPLEELEKEREISPEGKEQLARIKRNTKKLQHLVADLIDIHRMDKSKLRLQSSPVQIDLFIQQVLASFKPLSQKKRISLSFKSKTPRKEIWLDDYLMEQALSNLLSNAFKYTQTGGKIDVVVEENTFGDYLHIRILDNGLGISPTDIDHVFDPFYQGEQHLAGSGIGLAYVKEIVELHHGQITVSSKQHVGSSFTLRLPVGNAHLLDEEIKKQNTPIATIQTDFEEEFTPVDDPTVQNVSFHSNKSSNILIVEDHTDIRSFLKNILEKEYNVFFAPTYVEAIEQVEKRYPDLIICDIMLPDGSGLELLKTVKNNTRSSQIPVLLLSAVDQDETKIESMKLMADAYLTKPFNVEYLKAVIANLILSRKRLKERYSSLVEPLDPMSETPHTEQDKRFLQHLDLVVEARIDDQTLSIEDIAEELNISRVQLYRKTKSLLHCSVNEYVLQRRLHKSKHLIMEGYHINEVADKVGFSSATYYTVAFKKQFGITPTTFKKELLKRS